MIRRRIKARWDAVAKPIDGLGRMEELLCRIGAAQGTTEVAVRPRAVAIFCADNGIVSRGISQSGQDVTREVATWMGRGESTICRMAKAADADVIPVDIGIAQGETPQGVLSKKIMAGTGDFLTEEAMTEAQCEAAVRVGIDLAYQCKADGYRLLAAGEMGIGNTTTSAALAAILLHASPEDVTGRGAGLTDDALERKRAVIREAVVRYGTEEEADPKTLLRQIGGLDIAGMAGLFLGGAACGIPVVIDGFVSAVAALLAERIAPGTSDYMIASHLGRESGMRAVLAALDLSPVIDGDMALGEGTGAVLLFSLLDPVHALYTHGTRFEETAVAQYERFDASDPEEVQGDSGTSAREDLTC